MIQGAAVPCCPFPLLLYHWYCNRPISCAHKPPVLPWMRSVLGWEELDVVDPDGAAVMADGQADEGMQAEVRE